MKKTTLLLALVFAAGIAGGQVFVDGSFNARVLPKLSASNQDFGVQVYNLSIGHTFTYGEMSKNLSFDGGFRYAGIRNEGGFENVWNVYINSRFYLSKIKIRLKKKK